ncbi:MAG: MFS transporter [Oliverpabstia sp.]
MEGERLSRRDVRNLFGAGFAALASGGLSYSLIQSFFSFVYTEYLGMAAVTMGMVLSVGIVIDGVSDFLMGIVMDRVHSRHGKVRPWFLWMCIPLGLTCGLIFWAPNEASMAVKVAYVVILYNLYCTFLTAIRLPGQSLVSTCFENIRARQLASMINGLCNQLGSTISTTLIAPLVVFFGGELIGYRRTSILFAAGTVVAMLITFGLLRESKTDLKEINEEVNEGIKKKESIFAQIKMLLKNKYWLLLECAVITNAMAGGCLTGTLAYFCKYVLGDISTVGIMAAVLSFGMLIGIFASTPFIVRFDARNLSIFGCLFSIFGYLAAIVGFFTTHNPAALYIGMALKQFGTGFIASCDLDMVSRTVDYGEWKEGVRQDGMAFSGKGVMNKISSAAVAAIIGFILTSTGYIGGADAIPSAAVNAIRSIFLFAPVVMFVLSALIYFNFRLTGKQITEMRKEIKERRAAQ